MILASLLGFTTDYRVFFSEDNPQLLAFDALENTDTKNDNVMFILVPGGGDAFSEQTLEAVKTLTEKAWQAPYSIRVDSLSNFQHTEAVEDELSVHGLVGEMHDLYPDMTTCLSGTVLITQGECRVQDIDFTVES